MGRFSMLGIVGFACCCFCSCASERTVSYSKNESKKDISRYQSDVKYETQADGSVKPNKDIRSEYDGKSEYLGNRDFRGKNYATDQYRKDRWGGEKKYENKIFGVKKDGGKFRYSPEFVQQQAKVQGQVASVNGSRYNAGEYKTASNPLAKNAKRLSKRSDAATDIRRRVYRQPVIVDGDAYKEQEIKQSRELLGR